ncbi:MAG: hypothetical protein DME24_08460 [Verrucomicrobia bacterium]|nr:MAG: hypothetical protein DME24_08460 [Verrucomicrobiota bacterium]
MEKGNKNPIAHPTLNYVATVPDPPGASLAFVAEAIRRADPSTYRRVAQQVICGTGIVRIVSQEFVHSAHFHFIPAMTPLSLQGNANVMHLLDQAETGYWRSNFAWLRLSCAPMGCPPGPFAGWAGT